MFRQRLVQRDAPLDTALDIENELLHGWLVVAVADDLEGLHHRNSSREHCGELPAEHRDVFRLDLSSGLECLRLLADSRGGDTLTAQLRAKRGLVRRETLAFDARTALVLAFPVEGNVAPDCPDGRG